MLGAEGWTAWVRVKGGWQLASKPPPCRPAAPVVLVWKRSRVENSHFLRFFRRKALGKFDGRDRWTATAIYCRGIISWIAETNEGVRESSASEVKSPCEIRKGGGEEEFPEE